jgi:hypothetical protein
MFMVCTARGGNIRWSWRRIRLCVALALRPLHYACLQSQTMSVFIPLVYCNLGDCFLGSLSKSVSYCCCSQDAAFRSGALGGQIENRQGSRGVRSQLVKDPAALTQEGLYGPPVLGSCPAHSTLYSSLPLDLLSAIIRVIRNQSSSLSLDEEGRAFGWLVRRVVDMNAEQGEADTRSRNLVWSHQAEMRDFNWLTLRDG